MITSRRFFLLTAAAAVAFGPSLAFSADAPSPVSAGELAGKLAAREQDGRSLIRLRMESAKSGVLQLQVKSRQSREGSELVYQVLWPKERKGEGVLLRKSGGRISGTVFTPPDKTRDLEAGQLRESFLGSDLAYEDLVDNFFAWGGQSLGGTETVDRVPCQILESKPGKGDRSSYSSVRSWIDLRRMVPMRVEKYSGGKLVRRIETTRVVTDDTGRPLPANLSVQGPGGGTTEIDGSKIKHGVEFTLEEFSAEGLKKGLAQ